MPEMDGHEVCRQPESQRTNRDIPVIFVTTQRAAAGDTRAAAWCCGFHLKARQCVGGARPGALALAPQACTRTGQGTERFS